MSAEKLTPEEFLTSETDHEMKVYFERINAAKRDLPPGWLETVRLLATNQMEWASSIGIKANPVHDEHGGKFSNIKLMDASVFHETHPKGFRASASPFSDKELLLPDDTAPQDAFHLINHELVHTTDGEPQDDKIKKGVSRFFKTEDTSSIFPSEAVTEMINLESLDYLHTQNPERNYLMDISTVGYVPYLLVINELIENLAEKNNVNPLEIRKRLYKAYYAGTLDKEWDIFAEVDSAWPEKIRAFGKFETESDFIEFCTANGLGVDKIKRILDAYSNHEEIKIFGEVTMRTRKTDEKQI